MRFCQAIITGIPTVSSTIAATVTGCGRPRCRQDLRRPRPPSATVESAKAGAGDRSTRPRSGPSPADPALRVACDLQTFTDLALRTLPPSQALKGGRVTVLAGPRTALTEIFRVLVYTPHA
ncbi:hypothetical protein QRY02_18750 [Amycolatopsis sp. DG1A-15b]|nr:hypothetical protein [Amycolatopsis sp. DG1A-15b]WIX92370.1 hypothetical protein QRY02_18750 [Amycolatopsis sp. DG1A-15b]